MKRLVLILAAPFLLVGCETLLTMSGRPVDTDPNQRYDKSVDTQTVRDCA